MPFRAIQNEWSTGAEAPSVSDKGSPWRINEIQLGGGPLFILRPYSLVFTAVVNVNR